jgi:diguanylate cyclase (GGDEF)-like protein
VDDGGHETPQDFAREIREWTADHFNRVLIYAAWTTPPASLLFRWVLNRSDASGGVRTWMIAASAIAMTNWFLAALYLSARKQGWRPPRWWTSLQSVLLGALGLCWGLSMNLTVDSGDPSLNSLALVFAIAFICVGLVACGASASAFFAHTLGIAAPLLASMGLRGEEWMLRLIAPTTLFVCLILLLHLEVRRGALAEARLALSLRSSNDLLVGQNSALQQEVDTDGLTGLMTRQRFHSTLERMLERARFDRNHVGLLFIDVDNFKTINDTLGHQAGDEILRALSLRIRETARAQDVIGRLGGDELAVAIGPLARAEDAIAAAERLCASLRGSYQLGDRLVYATCSIGVAVGPHGVLDCAELIAHADAALYRAKEQGRNCVVAFDEDLRTAVTRRSDRIMDLQRAIRDGEIVPYLQPIVEISSGRIVGAEALARWQHPKQGIIAAATFVPFAEENGLGDLLNAAMTARIIELRRMWQLRGAPASFRFRLNVSASQLSRPGSLDELLTQMIEVRCPASGIALEITESAILADLRVARDQIARARDAGVTVELDDFGVGASSLSLLHELPLDVIKIDRGVIAKLLDDRRSLTLVEAVVMVAHNLDLQVTAEGVERADQAEVLGRLGIQLGQGYLYAPAIPPDQLLTRVLAGSMIEPDPAGGNGLAAFATR